MIVHCTSMFKDCTAKNACTAYFNDCTSLFNACTTKLNTCTATCVLVPFITFKTKSNECALYCTLFHSKFSANLNSFYQSLMFAL